MSLRNVPMWVSGIAVVRCHAIAKYPNAPREGLPTTIESVQDITQTYVDQNVASVLLRHVCGLAVSFYATLDAHYAYGCLSYTKKVLAGPYAEGHRVAYPTFQLLPQQLRSQGASCESPPAESVQPRA